MPQITNKLPPGWLKGLAGRLEEAMGDANFTQKDLEASSRVTQGNISLLLNQQRETGGTVAAAIRLANALHVRVGWFLVGEEPKRLPGVLPPPKPKLVDVDKEPGAHVSVRAKHSKK